MMKKRFIIICILCISILMIAAIVSCSHKDAQSGEEAGYGSEKVISETDSDEIPVLDPDEGQTEDSENTESGVNENDDGFGSEVDM